MKRIISVFVLMAMIISCIYIPSFAEVLEIPVMSGKF